jgi:hypothetical protein
VTVRLQESYPEEFGKLYLWNFFSRTHTLLRIIYFLRRRVYLNDINFSITKNQRKVKRKLRKGYLGYSKRTTEKPETVHAGQPKLCRRSSMQRYPPERLSSSDYPQFWLPNDTINQHREIWWCTLEQAVIAQVQSCHIVRMISKYAPLIFSDQARICVLLN